MEAILCRCKQTGEVYSFDGVHKKGKKVFLSRIKTGQKITIKMWKYLGLFERIS